MTCSEVPAPLRQALDALCEKDIAPLLAFLAEDVDWFVDWKGEGSFRGGPLHGRRSCCGRGAVSAFFADLYRVLEIRGVEVHRYIASDREVLILGRFHWLTRPERAAYASDWSMRWVLRDGRVEKCNFLTLAESQLSSFIPDYRTSAELDPEHAQQAIRRFQKLYLDAYLLGKTWGHTYWRGVPLYKCPLDLWIYQELIHDYRPDLIIETGTCAGGSALYMADMCEMFGAGRVVTIDTLVHEAGQPQHHRITYLTGSSTSAGIVAQVRDMVPGQGTVMVMLDSDHHRDHVLEELRIYGAFVSPGSYMIVEDTFLNGHPVRPNYGPGPMEAVDAFLAGSDHFVVDREKEKFLMTFHPRGYLRKVKG
jgi:cephalosporin hydroxylase/ketosteroid isomerase-like protein